MRNQVNDARRRLTKQGFHKKPDDQDTNKIDYSIWERADILLPGGGYREVWLKIKKELLLQLWNKFGIVPNL